MSIARTPRDQARAEHVGRGERGDQVVSILLHDEG